MESDWLRILIPSSSCWGFNLGCLWQFLTCSYSFVKFEKRVSGIIVPVSLCPPWFSFLNWLQSKQGGCSPAHLYLDSVYTHTHTHTHTHTPFPLSSRDCTVGSKRDCWDFWTFEFLSWFLLGFSWRESPGGGDQSSDFGTTLRWRPHTRLQGKETPDLYSSSPAFLAVGSQSWPGSAPRQSMKPLP